MVQILVDMFEKGFLIFLNYIWNWKVLSIHLGKKIVSLAISFWIIMNLFYPRLSFLNIEGGLAYLITA